jgi:hypothetical protein
MYKIRIDDRVHDSSTVFTRAISSLVNSYQALRKKKTFSRAGRNSGIAQTSSFLC